MLIDTSGFLSLYESKEPFHKKAVERARRGETSADDKLCVGGIYGVSSSSAQWSAGKLSNSAKVF